jgi:anti-anti-sigma factor
MDCSDERLRPTWRLGRRYSIMRVHGHRLSIAVVWRDDVVVVFLFGTADRSSVRLLTRTARALAQQQFTSVWLDLAGIERIDPEAARVLLGIRHEVASQGHEFMIRSPSSEAARVFASLDHQTEAHPT